MPQERPKGMTVSTRPENEIHNYSLSLLSWLVSEPINGGTDWHEVAAFDDEQDAKDYAEYLTKRSAHDQPYAVSFVGTRYGNFRDND